VPELPKNFIAQDLVDFIAWSSGKKSPTCDFCDGCGDPVAFRCSTCCLFLCNEGSRAHKRSRNSSSHIQEPFDVSSLDEATIKSALRDHRKAFCREHPDQLLKFFCESETCDRPICNDCALDEHKTHQYGHLTRIGEKHKGMVTALLGETHVHLETLKSAVSSIGKREAEVKMQMKELEGRINTAMKEIMTAVEERRNTLISELKTMCDDKLAALRAQKQSLLTLLNESEPRTNFANEVLRDGQTADILNLKSMLTAKLSEIKSRQAQLEPSENADVDSPIDMSVVLKALGECGRLCKKLPDVLALDKDRPTSTKKEQETWTEGMKDGSTRIGELPVLEERWWTQTFLEKLVLHLDRKEWQPRQILDLDPAQSDFLKVTTVTGPFLLRASMFNANKDTGLPSKHDLQLPREFSSAFRNVANGIQSKKLESEKGVKECISKWYVMKAGDGGYVFMLRCDMTRGGGGAGTYMSAGKVVDIDGNRTSVADALTWKVTVVANGIQQHYSVRANLLARELLPGNFWENKKLKEEEMLSLLMSLVETPEDARADRDFSSQQSIPEEELDAWFHSSVPSAPASTASSSAMDVSNNNSNSTFHSLETLRI